MTKIARTKTVGGADKDTSDAGRFAKPNFKVQSGYNENQGEFGNRAVKVKESGLPQTDPEMGRYKK